MTKSENVILKYLIDYDIIPYELCSDDDNSLYSDLEKENKPLPEDIYKKKAEKYFKVDISEEQIKQHLLIANAKNLRTIKNCIAFFTTIIVFAIGILIFALCNQ